MDLFFIADNLSKGFVGYSRIDYPCFRLAYCDKNEYYLDLGSSFTTFSYPMLYLAEFPIVWLSPNPFPPFLDYLSFGELSPPHN